MTCFPFFLRTITHVRCICISFRVGGPVLRSFGRVPQNRPAPGPVPEPTPAARFAAAPGVLAARDPPEGQGANKPGLKPEPAHHAGGGGRRRDWRHYRGGRRVGPCARGLLQLRRGGGGSV